MNLTHFMPTHTTNDAPGEASSLHHNTTERRSYQAYCVTEASSRPPSPDPFIPSLLRINAAPLLRANYNTRDLVKDAPEQNTRLDRAATGSPEARVNFTTLLKTEKSSKRQTHWANRARVQKSTIPATSDDITQPVTPRSSHSLVARKLTTCDQESSPLRVQPSEPVDGTTRNTFPREPVAQNSANSSTNCRPLPPLPIEHVALKDEHHDQYAGGDERISLTTLELCATPIESWSNQRLEDRDGTASSTTSQITCHVRRKHLPVPYDEYERGAERRGPAPPETLLSMLTLPPHDANICDSSKGHRVIALDHTQAVSFVESCVPRGHWSDTDEKVFAPRQKSLNNADLKYPASQPLPRGSNIPSRPLSHTSSNQAPSFGCCRLPGPVQSPSSHSSTDAQNGPRPPPWGSYEDLAIQRRQRNDMRERMQNLANNNNKTAVNTTLAYRNSLSTDSLTKDPAREVDEYREQILTVYPDMQFDGTSGCREGRLFCCVFM